MPLGWVGIFIYFYSNVQSFFWIVFDDVIERLELRIAVDDDTRSFGQGVGQVPKKIARYVYITVFKTYIYDVLCVPVRRQAVELQTNVQLNQCPFIVPLSTLSCRK